MLLAKIAEKKHLKMIASVVKNISQRQSFLRQCVSQLRGKRA
jgi:hypothetical protein